MLSVRSAGQTESMSSAVTQNVLKSRRANNPGDAWKIIRHDWLSLIWAASSWCSSLQGCVSPSLVLHAKIGGRHRGATILTAASGPCSGLLVTGSPHDCVGLFQTLRSQSKNRQIGLMRDWIGPLVVLQTCPGCVPVYQWQSDGQKHQPHLYLSN